MHSSIGAKAREAREALGVSIGHVARATGLSTPFVSEFEQGRRGAKTTTLISISLALKMDRCALIDMAGRLDEHEEAYVRAHPEAMQVLRAMVSCGVSEQGIRALLMRIEQGKI